MKNFSKGEAIRFGWNTTLKNLWFLIGLLLIAWFSPALLSLVMNLLKSSLGGDQSLAFLPVSIIFALLSGVLRIIVDIGLIQITLKFVDGQKAQVSDLFSGYPLFWNYLAGSTLYGLIVIGGFILLIIPGIIWSIKFGYYSYLIIDKKMGPIEALKQSSKITQGVKWNLLIFHMLLGLIILTGALALVVGLFVAIPTTMLASAFVYRKLSK